MGKYDHVWVEMFRKDRQGEEKVDSYSRTFKLCIIEVGKDL